MIQSYLIKIYEVIGYLEVLLVLKIEGHISAYISTACCYTLLNGFEGQAKIYGPRPSFTDRAKRGP